MTMATAAAGVFSRLELPVGGQHPGWRTDARSAALGWVAEHGFPTLKDEDWRYTWLGPILEVPFEPAAAGTGHGLTLSMLDTLALDLGGPRLVFLNGHFAVELSRLTGLPDGVTVTNLAAVLAAGPGRFGPHFVLPLGQHQHAFAALNDALTEDGAFIHLAAGTTVAEPIQLVFFSDTGGSPLVSSPRSVVLAGPGSRATIVETYAGIPGDVYCTNTVIEVVLEDGARIEHYKVQDEPETAFHVALLNVRQGRDSHFWSHSIALGAAIGRHEARVLLAADAAQVNLDGLYMPQRAQHHDNTILVEHAAPGCTSHQLYKGVMDGNGRGVFNGRIMVRPGADGTDANQKNKNLLLSDRAEVDTRPRLEIYADDVKCTHGAAVGQLDEEALFYLRSRGMSHQAARGVLIYAFAQEMVERIRLEPLRAHVKTLVTNRLSAGIGEVLT
jgi:Fe-S cluster assembly protein SufD